MRTIYIRVHQYGNAPIAHTADITIRSHTCSYSRNNGCNFTVFEDVIQFHLLHIGDLPTQWQNGMVTGIATLLAGPTSGITFHDIQRSVFQWYHRVTTTALNISQFSEHIFTGIHGGALEPPIFDHRIEATGRVVRFRGVSIYDVSEGLIQRETMYIDLATIMVGLGVGL